MSKEKLLLNGTLWSVLLFTLVVRWGTSLHSYSGESTPPMFGDYEAQRHWMEITVNLPLKDWYNHTKENDLMYWGLDYPPLTAYHSYLAGKVANFTNPAFVKLNSSRGYESYQHKLFMRSTVIMADVIIYFVSILYYYCNLYSNYASLVRRPVDKTYDSQSALISQIAISLLYPGLILIDHGHFQYNSVSLGLTIGAVACLIKNNFAGSALLFSCALNYKQMSLYHSLPFFIYMFSHCLPSRSQNLLSGIKRLFLISITVIITFTLIWSPFLLNLDICLQVLRRLFPFARGVFEDKVSNFWCALNVVYKLKDGFNQGSLTQLCLMTTLLSSLPSLINLFIHPNFKRLLLSLINVSLSFFLFSYQVHEKSILLVAIPAMLYFPIDPMPTFWFCLTSTFSLIPLLLKDNLIIPFISLSVIYILVVCYNINFESLYKLKKNSFYICKFLFLVSLTGHVILFFAAMLIPPPLRFPDLWPLLNSLYSAFHFAGFFCYFNYVQIFSKPIH